MSGKNIFSAAKLVYEHLWLSDILIALLGFFVFSCILQKIISKGPVSWPVFGIMPSVVFHLDNIYDWATNAFIATGGTFSFRGVWMSGAFGFATANPSSVEYMLKTRFKNFPKGKHYSKRFHDFLGDGIFNSDNEVWKEQRRIASFEMHTSRFVSYSMQTIRDLVHHKLLKLLDKAANSGEFLDLQEILLRFTFDNICTAAFGVDPGCLALDLPEVPFAKAFEQAAEISSLRFLVPPFIWIPMRHFGIGFEKNLKEAIRIVHEFAEKTVTERRMQLNKQDSLNNWSDLLSRLVEIEKLSLNKSGKTFRPNFLKDFCISFILAGRDTSSVGLAWFFWLIHNHPEVEAKILEEINQILNLRSTTSEERPPTNDDDDGDDKDIIFTIEELKKMVYLQAALSESLRLYPPVPVDFKEATEDDCFPDGTVVKKGSRIFYCIYSMGRMKSIWGEDCLEFKPERWLHENGEEILQFKYVVFNAGPRLCVGKRFAYMQMKMVAASILLRYSVEVVEGHQVCPKITTTLYMKNGLLVHFKPRKWKTY